MTDEPESEPQSSAETTATDAGSESAAEHHEPPVPEDRESADPEPGAADHPDEPERSGEPGEAVARSADEAADADPDSATAPGASGHSRSRAGHRRNGGRNRTRRRGKKRRKAPWWEWPALILLAIVIAILVKTFLIQPFYIPSASMENTLHGSDQHGHDRILVSKIVYDFRDPHPGDIVVFHAPPGWDDEPVSQPPDNPFLRVVRGFGQLIGFVPPDGEILVKRVIATGGQTVKGDKQGHVMVSAHGPDGPYRTLDEPYVRIDEQSRGKLRAFGPVTVPKGRLWVMGDHRNDSADSRYHCGINGTDSVTDIHCNPVTSTVPVDDVIGKAIVVAWPPSHWRTLGTPSTFEAAAAAAAPAVPTLAALGVVVPLAFVRRRRRRR